MKRYMFLVLPLLVLIVAASCNKPKSYTIKLKNLSAGPIRVRVAYDQAFAAPGQTLLQFDKNLLQNQEVEVYYNEGIGITLPMKDDTTLKYTVDVWNADSVPCLKNFRVLKYYFKTADKKEFNTYYEGRVTIEDFPE
jgi:uncharacterized lipoprotein NlpE involved in copper resistance